MREAFLARSAAPSQNRVPGPAGFTLDAPRTPSQVCLLRGRRLRCDDALIVQKRSGGADVNLASDTLSSPIVLFTLNTRRVAWLCLSLDTALQATMHQLLAWKLDASRIQREPDPRTHSHTYRAFTRSHIRTHTQGSGARSNLVTGRRELFVFR